MAHKVLKWSLHFFLSTCQARSWQSVGTVSGILPTRLCPHTVIQGRRSCGAFISNSLKQLKQTQNVASVIEEQSLKISLNFNSFKKPTFSNYPFCIHMCVCVYEHMYACLFCVCACKYVCVSTSMCAHGGQLLILGVFDHLSSCVLRQCFSLNLEFTDYLDWAPSKSWGSSFSTLPTLRL